MKDNCQLQITFEGLEKMLFRNFEGVPKKFNAEGARNFCAVISEEEANELRECNWNVKTTKRSEKADEGWEPEHYIKVNVNFNSRRPPKIVVMTETDDILPDGRARMRKVMLTEENVNLLDWADVVSYDMVINAYEYESRVSAYLKTLYVTVLEDAIERKYSVYDDEEEYADEAGTD